MSPPERASDALAGWRVLEIADGLAASFCGKVLSDLGADVVKVEPPEGHASRRWALRRAGAAQDEPGGRFLYLNSGKASVIVPAGRNGDEDREWLAAACDVLVTDDAAWHDRRATSALDEATTVA